MNRVERIIEDIIRREGGYVNHPSDPGGETKFGITLRTARAHGYEGRMRDLPIETARKIYRHIYWEAPGFARVAGISALVAEELMDTGVNCGKQRAKEWFQSSLNAFNRGQKDYPDLVVDGVIGPVTLNTLAAYLRKRGLSGVEVLIKALDCEQGAHYLKLGRADEKFEDFTFGWFKERIGNIRQFKVVK